MEGTEFTFNGQRSFISTFVASDALFHFTERNRFSSTLVPVNGQGPTYVEGGNVEETNFSAHDLSAGTQINFTHVINDQFLGYLDGKLVASATIRIHVVEHAVVVDTDGDGVPDVVRASFTIENVSCPA